MENNKLIDGLDFLTKEELETLVKYFKLSSRIAFLEENKKMLKNKGYGEYGNLVGSIMNKVKPDPNKELAEFITEKFVLDEWIEEIEKECHQLYEEKVKYILNKIIAGSYCNNYLNSLVKAWEEKAGVNNDENQN